MPFRFTNNSSTTLAASLASGALSLTVSSGTGALFPSLSAGEVFNAVLMDSSNNLEIVQVTARTGDTFTIVRAQEGTVARAFSSGDRVELRMTAAALTNFVQLDGAQTITGAKTFSTAPNFSTALSVASGGTGVQTLTGLAYGNGTGAFSAATGAQISSALGSTAVQNASAATLAAKGSTLASGGGNGSAMTFSWSGQSGQPTWLWGGNDIGNSYVYNPVNFNVNSAKFLASANWQVAQEAGGVLVFRYDGTTRFYIEPSGSIVVGANITAGGTVTANG